jgi:hypothetical protein
MAFRHALQSAPKPQFRGDVDKKSVWLPPHTTATDEHHREAMWWFGCTNWTIVLIARVIFVAFELAKKGPADVALPTQPKVPDRGNTSP